MKLRNSFLLAFILSLVLSFSFPVVSFAQSLGTLKISKGVVKIRRAGKDMMFKGQKEIEIFKNDEIQTGSDSKAFVHLSRADDRINLFSGTFFKVGSASADSTEVTMKIGKAKFKIKKPAKGKKRKRRFSVRTANAVIGVKGTEFLLGVNATETNLLTTEGSVGFSSAATPGTEVAVQANQASKVSATSTPTAPSKVSPEIQRQILSSDSGKGWDKVKFSEPVPPSDDKKKKENKKEEKKESKKEEKKGDEKKEAKKDSTPNDPKAKGQAGGLPPPGGPLAGGAALGGALLSSEGDPEKQGEPGPNGEPPPPLVGGETEGQGPEGALNQDTETTGLEGPPPIDGPELGDTELGSGDFGPDLGDDFGEDIGEEFADLEEDDFSDITDEINDHLDTLDDELTELTDEANLGISITIQN
ncbi:MAG: FecR domain-containing protein [SAR324 cluster bacterium]|nr:FecR domain-containing protein [SAR324 cluster bacterium]